MDVFLKAYVADNLGDDLFIKIICDRYKSHRFHLISNIESSFLSSIENLFVYKDSFITRAINKVNQKLNKKVIFSNEKKSLIKNSDITVYIGGSIFMETAGWQSRLNELNKEINLSNSYYVIGANYGPQISEEFYNRHLNAFSCVNDICFRDTKSFELFKSLPNVRYAPDVVFTLDYEVGFKESEFEDENKFVIISVIDLSNRDNFYFLKSDYEEKMAKLTEYFVERGIKVLLMSFCKSEGDEEAINRIYEMIELNKKDKVKRYFYNGNLDEALSIISLSSGVVANRFHSMILALLFKKNFFPLIYSKKTSNVLSDINYPHSSLRIENIEKISNSDVFNQIFNKRNISEDIEWYINSADNQFEKLDDILKNHL